MWSILIIDDDPQVRMMLRMTFEEEGYSVLEASDGAEGVKRYQESPTDLVITDILMPEKEGLEIIMELRQMNPDVKVIAISGGGKLSAKGYLETAEHLGAVCAFPKPVDRQKLVSKVKDLIPVKT